MNVLENNYMVFVIYGEKLHVHWNKQLFIVLQIPIYLLHHTLNFFEFLTDILEMINHSFLIF
jgi:hypothetical protein